MQIYNRRIHKKCNKEKLPITTIVNTNGDNIREWDKITKINKIFYEDLYDIKEVKFQEYIKKIKSRFGRFGKNKWQ